MFLGGISNESHTHRISNLGKKPERSRHVRSPSSSWTSSPGKSSPQSAWIPRHRPENIYNCWNEEVWLIAVWRIYLLFTRAQLGWDRRWYYSVLRDWVLFWPLDPGWEKSGSGMNIPDNFFREIRNSFLGLKYGNSRIRNTGTASPPLSCKCKNDYPDVFWFTSRFLHR